MACNAQGTNLAVIFQGKFPLTIIFPVPVSLGGCGLLRVPRFYMSVLYIHVYVG